MKALHKTTLNGTFLKILLVEDNPNDAELIQELLLEETTKGGKINLKTAIRLSQGLKLLRQEKFDAILLDISLPDSQGVETVARVQEYGLNIPIVVLTAHNDEELAVQSIQAGAQDYLIKRQVNSQFLIRTLRCAIERQKRQSTWQLSEEKYRSVVDNTKEVIFQTDIAGNWTFLNPAWSEITGFSIAETLGNAFLNYIHPEDQPQNLEKFSNLLEGNEKCCRHQSRYLTKSGELRWLEVQLRLTFALDGTITGTTGTFNDITQQVLAQEKLQASKDFLNHTLNAIPDPIFVKDEQHRWITFNDAFCQLMGKTRAELLGKSDYDFLPKEQADIFWEKDNLVFEQGSENENEETLTDGEGKEIIIATKKSIVHNQDGSKLLVGIIRDITEIKRQQYALEKSEARFQRLAENVPGMIYQFCLSPDGSISFPYVSRGCRELYGLNPEEIQQNPSIPFEKVYPEDRPSVEESIAISAATLQPWQKQWRQINTTGQIKWLQAASRPERQGNGDILWDGLVMDISELKQARAERDRFFTISLDLLSITGFDGIFKSLNPAWSKILGYTEEQLLCTPWIEFIHPEDRETTLKELEKLKTEARVSIEFENRFRCEDGSYKWLAWRAALFTEQNSIYAVARDITERKQKEDEMQLLLTTTQSINESHNLSDALNITLKLLGEKINCDFAEAWLPSVDGNVLENSQSCYAKEQSLELFLYQSQKTTFAAGVGLPGRIWSRGESEWIENICQIDISLFNRKEIATKLGLKACFGVPISDGKRVLAVLVFFYCHPSKKQPQIVKIVHGIATNLGSHLQRKIAENALRLTSERLQLALESSALGMWDWNISTGKTYFDPQWKKMLGYEVEEIENNYQSWEKLLHPEDLPVTLEALTNYLQGSNKHYEVEFRMLTKSGGWKWILATAKVVERSEEGMPIRMTGTHKDISDRKAAEKANLKLTNQLQEAQRITHLGNWEFDITTGAISWSDELFRIYGRKLGDVPTFEEVLNQIHPEDRPRWLQGVQKAMVDGTAYDIDHRIYLASGEIRYINSKGQGLKNQDGQIVALFGTAMDITERKLVEAALRENEERFRAIFEQAALGIAQVWPDGQFLKVNQGFCNIVGYSQPDLLLRTVMEITHREDVENDCKYMQQLLAGEIPSYSLEKRFIRNNGEPVWVNLTVSLVRDSFNQPKYLVKIVEDISVRKQTEAELSSTRVRLQHLISSSPAVIYSCKLSGDYGTTFISENVRHVTGYEPQRFIEDSSFWANNIHPEDAERIFSELKQLFKQGYSCHEYRFLHADGTYHWFRDDLKVVFDENGNPREGVGSWIDITERKQAIDALRQQLLQQRLLGTILERIRSSLNLQEILRATVEEVRQFLQTDRTVIYRFHSDWNGTVVVESSAEKIMPIIGMNIQDNCFAETYAHLYQQGRIRAVENLAHSDFKDCHKALLSSLQVQANLVIPIIQGEKLWGLLIAHHCTGSRKWHEYEIECLKQISLQLAIALQQSMLFEQAKTEIIERKQAEAALRDSEARERAKALQLEVALNKLRNAQTQLVQNEKMVSLGQLVAGVAHEINNPVNFIYGNLTPAHQYASDLLQLVQLYLQYYPKPPAEITTEIEAIDLEYITEDLPKLFKSMKLGAERIAEIVKSLRTFSRLDEAEMKSVDIRDGIESTLMILQNRFKYHGGNPGIHLIKRYEKLPEIECYAGQLNQVFMNILVNALDALEARDKNRSLEEKIRQPSTIIIHTYLVSPERVRISITDNGPGIPEQIRLRLFDPFFTTKPIGKGTGLGLSISHSIVVERHGGTLTCFSQQGEGAEFVIEIPVFQQ